MKDSARLVIIITNMIGNFLWRRSTTTRHRPNDMFSCRFVIGFYVFQFFNGDCELLTMWTLSASNIELFSACNHSCLPITTRLWNLEFYDSLTVKAFTSILRLKFRHIFLPSFACKYLNTA